MLDSGVIRSETGPWHRNRARRREISPDERWTESKIRTIVADCHPRQRDFVLDPALRIAARVGREGGKTTGGVARFLIKMLRVPRAQCIFAATTRPQAEILIWERLLTVFELLEIEHRPAYVKLWITVTRTGSVLRLVGLDDKKEINKLRGMPFDEVGIDEAAVHSPQLLEQLIDRVIEPRLKGALWMVSTPGHVQSGPFYDATRPGSPYHRPYAQRDNPDYAQHGPWSSHTWALSDPEVQHVPPLKAAWERALANKAAKHWGDDHPVWRREYLGEWAADDTEHVFRYVAHRDGRAWNQWNPERIRAGWIARLPEDRTDWHYAVALDMGSTDAFACNVFAFSPSDPQRRIYHVYSVERVKMYAREIATLLVGEDVVTAMLAGRPAPAPGGIIGEAGWPDGLVMDADQPLLDELSNVYGIRIAKAEKKRDYKIGAIELVNGDLVEGRIVILKDSPLEQQLMRLQWRPDEFGQRREDPSQDNHSTDCLIYGRRAIAHMFGGDEATSSPARPVSRVMPEGRGEDPAEIDEQGDYSAILADPDYDATEWG